MITTDTQQPSLLPETTNELSNGSLQLYCTHDNITIADYDAPTQLVQLYEIPHLFMYAHREIDQAVDEVPDSYNAVIDDVEKSVI